MDSDRQAVSETWVYTGVRLDSNKLLHSFRSDSGQGESLYFSKLKGRFSIGGLYAASVVRDGDKVSLRGSVQLLSSGLANPEWTCKDEEAKARKASIDAEKRAIKDGGLGKLTLYQLRQELVRLPHPQRVGLLAAMLSFLTVRV